MNPFYVLALPVELSAVFKDAATVYFALLRLEQSGLHDSWNLNHRLSCLVVDQIYLQVIEFLGIFYTLVQSLYYLEGARTALALLSVLQQE